MKSFLRSSFIITVVRLAGAFFQILLVALAVWQFPVDTVGQNAILWSTAVLGRVGGALGFDLFSLRELPAQTSEQKPDYLKARSINKTHAYIWVLIGVLTYIAFLILSDVSMIMWLLPIAFISSSMHRLYSCQLRAFGSIYKSQILDSLLVPTLAIIFLLFSMICNKDYFLVGQTLAMAIGAFSVWMSLKLPREGKAPLLKMSDVVSSLPLGLGAMLSVVASRSPIFILGSHSIGQVAVLDIGQRVHSAASIAAASASNILLPRVRQLHNSSDFGTLRSQIRLGSLTGAIPGLVIALVLILLGPDNVAMVLGDEYAGAWAVTILMSLAACVSAIGGISHGVLAMMGKNRLFTLVAFVHAVLTISMTWIFATTATTAAVVILALEVVRCMILIIISHKILTPRKFKH